MPATDLNAARAFAEEVVRRLRAAGYEALWAGGCVRDQLLGRLPKDYDVATTATPDQIRAVFGYRRTRAIGAAFGVITVLGPKGAGQVEVATFRRDSAYSDGRHPDSVTFSTAQEDALRRDFTINGIFLNPLNGEVIDYVGGADDLRNKVVRAIGDPHQRFAEDKLRMLRAVRFAATLDFSLDPATLAAVREHAAELQVVSAERIGDELRRMLMHPLRRRALELLQESELLRVLLPEIGSTGTDWQQTLQICERWRSPTAAVVFAGLLRQVYQAHRSLPQIQEIGSRWRLSNEEREGVSFCLTEEMTIRRGREVPWPRLQRVLIEPRVEELLCYAAAVAEVMDGSTQAIDYCRTKLALPPEVLNPPPLITGNHLRARGIPPGRAYKQILTEVRDAQLRGEVTSAEAGLALALRLWRAMKEN